MPSVDSAPAEEPSGEFQAEQTSADSKKKTDPTWTFFIYAQGDNLHSPAFAADLASIKNAKLGKSVHVVVLADWNASITDASGKALFQPGADRFVFGGASGNDTIGDFETGRDVIDVSALGITSTAGFSSFTDDGTSTTIVFSPGNQVIVQNVLTSQLAAGDFIFA